MGFLFFFFSPKEQKINCLSQVVTQVLAGDKAGPDGGGLFPTKDIDLDVLIQIRSQRRTKTSTAILGWPIERQS